MHIAGGILVLLASILCALTGSCELLGTGATRLGKATVATGLKLLEDNADPAAALSPAERRLLRERGLSVDGAGRDQRVRRITTRVREALNAVDGSGQIMLLSGGLSLVGGILGFAAAVLLLVQRSRAFIVVSLLIALMGTALSLMTPFTIRPLVLVKALFLAFGLIAALGIRAEADPRLRKAA